MAQNGYNTNLAAEFHVLSTLHRMGMEAMLTLGNCQLESGNKTTARKTYGDLIASYPDTEVAVEARQMLPRTK